MSLVRSSELPEWHIKYRGIYDEYRSPRGPFQALLSIFEWHTETLNIYTHLVLGLYYIWKLLWLSPGGSLEHQFLLWVAYSGAAMMGIFSGFAHTFFIVNYDWYYISWKLDFIGIIAINFSHHLFDTFVLTKGILGNRELCLIGFYIETLFAIYCICRIAVCDLEIGRYWAFMYPIITCIPLTVTVYIYSRISGVNILILQLTQGSMNCTCFIIVAGLLFFKGGFPERYYNPHGIFNKFNSHTWHHIFCIFSIIAAFEGLPKLFLLE